MTPATKLDKAKERMWGLRRKLREITPDHPEWKLRCDAYVASTHIHRQLQPDYVPRGRTVQTYSPGYAF